MDAFKGNSYSYNPVKNLTERDRGALQEYSIIDLNAKLNILDNLSTELKLGRQGHSKKEQDYKSRHSASVSMADTMAGRRSRKRTGRTGRWSGWVTTTLRSTRCTTSRSWPVTLTKSLITRN